MSDQVNLSGKVGLDVTDFKDGVAELNRNIKIIDSGFKATAAGMDDWSSTAEGLQARLKALTDITELQRQKVDATRKEYERIKKETGDTSIATRELEIRLNKETEALNKSETEARQTQEKLNGLGKEASQTGTALGQTATQTDTAASRMERLKSVAGGIGGVLKGVGTVMLGVASAAAAAGMGVAKLVTETAAQGEKLVDMSTKTGISVETLQELGYIGEQVGTDLDTITGSYSKMIRAMSSEGKAEAFAGLGVAVRDTSGQLRDSQAVFTETITALGKIPNETERDALAMELFGKSAMELNPLIETSAEQFESLREEAHKVGAVMDTESVESAAAFQDQLDSLKMGLQGTAMEVGAAFMPAFSGLADSASGYLKDLAGVVNGADGDLGKLAGGVGEIAGKVVGELAKQAPAFLQAGLSIVQGIVTAIVQNLPAMIPGIIELMNSLVQFIVQNLPMLLDAAMSIILALMNGIIDSIPKLIPAVVEVVLGLVDALIANLPMLITAGIQMIVALAVGLIDALPELVGKIPELLGALVGAIIYNLPVIFAAAVDIIGALALGLIDAFPKLVEAGSNLFNKLLDWFKGGGLEMWREMGGNVIKGVWQGIEAKWGNLSQDFKKMWLTMIDDIKKLLGIKSPSRVFAGIGMQMAAGLGVGFMGQMGGIEKRISGAVADLTRSVGAPGLGLAGMGVGGVSESYTFYAPVIVQANDARGFGTSLRQKRL
jgi:phage-related protein